jgi:Chalcone isomerase-like
MKKSIVFALICAAGITMFTALSASAQEVKPLPSTVSAENPALKLRGKTLLRVFGFRIYHGFLWTQESGDALKETHALDLEYLRNFEGEALATRSIDEMKSQGIGSEAQYEPWLKEMRRIFPNVKPNDRITGVHMPGKGAKFFHNGKPTGEVNDPEFAKAFFDIWLSPKTTQPGMRKELLANP